MSERKRKLEVYEGQPGANGVASAVPSFGNGTVNLYTGKPYSQRYYDILSKRKGAARAPAPTRAFPATYRAMHLRAKHLSAQTYIAPALTLALLSVGELRTVESLLWARVKLRPCSAHACIECVKQLCQGRKLPASLRRAAGVAGSGGLRRYDQWPPDDHPRRRDGVRQDHPDRAVHC
jgi:hypothetical protein